MSTIPDDLRYTAEHEWIRMEGDLAIVGITDYAQDALTDIVWVEFLIDEGQSIEVNGTFASVESVKSVSEIYAPVAGTVTEVNHSLEDSPEKINEDPYGSGWICKIKVDPDLDLSGLLDAGSYSKLIGE